MKYSHILSPVTIRNKVLKSRIIDTKCISFQQDNFKAALAFYEKLAKNGASTVTMSVGSFPDCEGKYSPLYSSLRMDDPKIQDEFTRMIDRIHSYDTLCSASLMSVEPLHLAISDTPNWDEIPMTGDYNPNLFNKSGISAERLEGMIRDFVSTCVELKRLGFDMVTFYMSYRASIMANSLSPVLNQRTDKYGGKTVAERARLSHEVFRRVKEACGQDFPIEVQISAEEEAPGFTVDDWLEYCKLSEELVDIFQTRAWDGSYAHATGYSSRKSAPYALRFAEAFKKRGIKSLVAPVGGFGSPDEIERFIAEGKTDLVAMGRALIADDDYGLKLAEGKGEDVRPCLLCNKCHDFGCSVNPMYGLAHREEKLLSGNVITKNVAVIGGGPAGMRVALEASRRGHRVTLFEKTNQLGGQLRFSDYVDFKWPVKEYKDWLIRQIAKSGIKLMLGCEATTELIKQGKYDAVICALGSSATTVPVKYADGVKVWKIDEVYGSEQELGERVVVIGGSSSGRETALYLARCGHKVTMLTRSQEMYTEDSHCIRAVLDAFKNEKNFACIEFASTTEIGAGYVVCDIIHGLPRKVIDFLTVHMMAVEKSEGKVTEVAGFIYPQMPSGKPSPGEGGWNTREMDVTLFPRPKDCCSDGQEVYTETRRIECDSVVVTGGRTPNVNDARKFTGLAPRVFIIGDNAQPGSIKECTLNAMAAALEL